MIIKISKSGSSFKGAANYTMHDPRAQTSERVDWTYTHNLANDHVPAAVNEMYITAESAEWLKQQAGVHPGGRPSENPVKPIIMSWAKQDDPSKDHMIKSGLNYLKEMGWSEHQAIFVSHNDQEYAHLHILLNAIHPETGKKLDDSLEHRRSQEWALKYELEQNRVYCTERLKDVAEREKNMPRNIHKEFDTAQRDYSESERKLRQNSENQEYSGENRVSAEWEIFKEIQRVEREQFIEEGSAKFKQLRNAVYREVREEFRDRWAEYYEARRNGSELDLATLKKSIVDDQKAILGVRRGAACAELKETREQERQDLNARQRGARAEFRARLETGIDNADFFNGLVEKQRSQSSMKSDFRDAGREIASRQVEQAEGVFFGKIIDSRLQPISREPYVAETHESSARQKDVADIATKKTVSLATGLANGLFSFLTNMGSAGPEPMTSDERKDLFRQAAEDAVKQEQQRGRDDDDAAWRERQKSFYRE